MVKLFFVTIILLGLCFVGIAIKIWGKKGGRFSGTCASQNPFLNNQDGSCSYCGKKPEQQQQQCNNSTTNIKI